ncbi:hypothetical protein pb186bvf_013114 [Paramecium bursaria]
MKSDIQRTLLTADKMNRSKEFNLQSISRKSSVIKELPTVRSYMSGQYNHGSQYITDLSKIFVKSGYNSSLNHTPSSQSIVTQKDQYITKLTPNSQDNYSIGDPPQRFTASPKKNRHIRSFAQKRKLQYASSLPGCTQSKMCLIILNRNLNKISKIEELNYCYFNMPIPKQFSSQRDAEILLQEVNTHLIDQLKLGQILLHFFSRKGEPIKSAFECNHQTIIVSQTKQFNGISNEALDGIINNLESFIPDNDQKKVVSLEEHINQKYSNKILNIADFLQNKNQQHFDSTEIESLYQKCKKKQFDNVHKMFHHKFNSIQVNTVAAKYKSQQEYLNDESEITSSARQGVQQKLINKYEGEIRKLEKEMAQNVNSDEAPKTELLEGKLVPKQAEHVSDEQVKMLSQMLNNHESQFKQTNFVAFKKQDKKQQFGPPITKKQLLLQLNKINPLLYQQNIPHLQRQTSFTRKELYQTHILYKALEAVSSQMTPNYEIGEGVGFDAFRNGIYQVFMQPHELAQSMFNTIDYNFSGFLNWQEFLDLMVCIKAKTLVERVNLFIKIADKDGNGQLSRDEVYNLAHICLGRYIKSDQQKLLEQLCEYFTKLIFETLEVNINEEIPLKKIKDAILSGGPNSELLSMFCGADI